MMEILTNILYYIVPFVILLGILVFVHEFGHFIVARILGVKVVAFSIGFGKELWSHTDKKGTCWKISAVPLGGYCQFLGDADASSSTSDNASLKKLTKAEKKMAFPFQKPWKKLAIVVAGPLFNYLLAILIFGAVFYTYGKMVYPSVVGEVIENSAAAEAGILSGDKILSINGKPTPDFHALSNEVAMSETDDAIVELERPLEVTLKTEELTYCECGENKTGKMIGVRSLPADRDEETNELKDVAPIINEVFAGGPAEKAGLLPGDVVQSINDTDLTYFSDLKKYVEEHAEEDLVVKGYRPLRISVRLKETKYENGNMKEEKRMLGVKSAPRLTFSEKLDFTSSVRAGFKEAYDLTAMSLRGVWQMITGQRGGKDLGGIIRIAEMSGDISKTGGLIGFIYFMALLSVNLGLINLFPIPVLDGGNLVIFIIEMLNGEELKPRTKEYIFRFGLGIILAIMVLATWNDVAHLFDRWFAK